MILFEGREGVKGGGLENEGGKGVCLEEEMKKERWDCVL